VIEERNGDLPISRDTVVAEEVRAGGADHNLFRILVLMWGAIRTIASWLHEIPSRRAAPSG
jgi:hypothetical protein